MGNSSSQTSDCKVVIIGGGYAGIAIATNLDLFCNVTLIDPKTYFHHCVGSLRAAVSDVDHFEKQVIIPYLPAIQNGVFKQGTVIGVNTFEKYVTLQSEETIQYDYVVFACGSSCSFPGKLPLGSSEQNTLELYEEFRGKIKDSKKIVIIGGGAIGVELAGEIIDIYQDKNIHIIHSGDVLADPDLSSKFHRNLLSLVKNKGVNVILGEKVNLDELDFQSVGWLCGAVTVQTDKGSSIEGDMVIKCIGIKINSEAYKSTLSDKMDEKNQLKVNEFFQVEGLDNVFAVGDCCNSKETKEAYVAGLHAENVCENIRRLCEKKPLKVYKCGRVVMVVPFGRNGGVSQLPNGAVFGNFVTKKFKSQKLFVPKTWKSMHQTVPY